jgi:hypothetical protein
LPNRESKVPPFARAMEFVEADEVMRCGAQDRNIDRLCSPWIALPYCRCAQELPVCPRAAGVPKSCAVYTDSEPWGGKRIDEMGGMACWLAGMRW